MSCARPWWALCVLLALTIGGCAPDGPSDEELRERVEAALASASDVPGQQIQVEVSDGVVTLSGSIVCEDCGGTQTPGGLGTVQQSLGAVVRAVPGVQRVEFSIRTQP